MQYKLVPADRSHLPQLAALERACFSHPWSEAMLAEELYNDNASLVAAEGEDGTMLGYGMVRAVLDDLSAVRTGSLGLSHPGGAGGQRSRHRPL